jgi:uncharacterized protein (DUF885 family)
VPADHPVFALSDRFVDDIVALQPMAATLLGVDGHDDRWGDLGPDGLAASVALLESTRAQLDALPEPQDRFDALAVRVLRDVVDDELLGHADDEDLRDLAHIASTLPTMIMALDVQDVGAPEGREAVLRRLEALPAALATWRDRIALALDRDAVVARRQALSVIAQIREAAAPGGAHEARVDAIAAADPALDARARRSLDGVREATEATARMLEERYLPRALDADGVGRERYLRQARRHLGMALDVAEVYAWGWEELGRLLERARVVAARIDGGADLREVLRVLGTDPAHAAPTHAEFRRLMAERQDRALALLAGEHFDVPDAIRAVDVRLAPPSTPPGAWYVGPSEDLQRRGSIWWSLGEEGPVPLFDAVSTAYHEGFPGHHLQIGTATLLSDRLSRTHRLIGGTAGYKEGWALYAERLMDELGFLDEPAHELGYLAMGTLRVLRVVMDIGLHLDLRIPEGAPIHPGEPWTFDVAVDALEALTGTGRALAVSEVTRYLGWPGQAISYALGQRTILELREERRTRDGAAFDLRAFHAEVLGSGAVGLDHLRELVLA